jgi:hypothetical protein
MRLRQGLTLAMLALGAASGAAAAAQDSPETSEPNKDVQQLLQNCDAHKFETTVEAVIDGQPSKKRVKLCGKDGQSDADWIGTLKDAIVKLKANPEMDAGVRQQIVNAINAEIARIEMTASANMPKARQAQANPARSISSDYSALPPLPATPPPPPSVLGPTASTSTSTKMTPVSSDEAPYVAPVASVPVAAATASLPTGPVPKLSFDCSSTSDIGGPAPCAGFSRDTLLTIKAQDNLPAGVSLRFLRNGEQRAEVRLAEMKRGKSLRIALPRAVCAGVGDGSLDLKIVQNGAVVKSDGPYALRC